MAELYGVETRIINQAVKNNPNKFPDDFLIELTAEEWQEVRSKFLISPQGGGRTYRPKAFAERGLYMLATILKGERAVNTTIAIIRTFKQIKQLTQSMYDFSKAKTNDQRVTIFENSAEVIADLLGNDLTVGQDETTLKFKLPFLEITRKITKVKK